MAVQQLSWDNEVLLEQNRHRLLTELLATLHTYEARYELDSDRLEAELVAGRMRETAEICDWVITLHSYHVLQRENLGE